LFGHGAFPEAARRRAQDLISRLDFKT